MSLFSFICFYCLNKYKRIEFSGQAFVVQADASTHMALSNLVYKLVSNCRNKLFRNFRNSINSTN